MKQPELSRRQFIKGAAASTVGIAAAGMLEGCTPKTATPAPAPADAAPAAVTNPFPFCEDLSAVNAAKNKGDIAFVSKPITDLISTEKVDVLICGQGPSGMAAALACAEKGLKVVAVEKGDAPTYRSPTMGAFNDRIHKKFGVTFDTKQWMDDAMVNCSYRGSQAIYQKWIDSCDEAVDWFLDKLGHKDEEYFLTFNAGDFKDFNAPYDELSLSRSWNTSINLPMAPKDVAATLQQKITAAGAIVMFNTPVVQLVIADGKVTGAIIKTEKGYVKYETAKGVVLATGGYEYNPDKLNACCRPRDLALSGWMSATMTNTGDGHEMAKAIGAMEDEYPHPLMLDPQQLMPFLRVNKNGQRFAAEYEAYNHLSNAIQSQPGAYGFYIVDANCAEIVDKLWTPSSGCYAPKEVWVGAATSQNALTANTLEELAGKMGVDAKAFVATINHWNEMCDAGEDTDFHFPGKMMHKIDKAPFYANKEMAEGLTTVGGLQITPESQVLDTKGNIIPGLYAIGNVSGSMFSGTYPHNQNCLSHSRCITFGYNLAKTLTA
jgi:succinate dehydrogenase/fumarate reductase flavoprotein subunit